MKNTFADLLIGDTVVAVKWDDQDARLLTVTKIKFFDDRSIQVEFDKSYFERIRYLVLSKDDSKKDVHETAGNNLLYLNKQKAKKYLRDCENERMEYLLNKYERGERIVSDPNTVPSLRRQEEKTLQGTTKKLLVTEERYKRLYEEIGD